MPKRQVTQYSEEFKQSSAKLAYESKHPITMTAKELGVNSTTLHGWVNKYYPNKKTSSSLSEETGLEAENKRLRKELHRVTQERDILKKATAYFAHNSL
jgi:transposase-like protein